MNDHDVASTTSKQTSDSDNEVEQEDEQEDDGLWFAAGFLDDDDDLESDQESSADNKAAIVDLDLAVQRLRQDLDQDFCKDCRERTQIVMTHMGSMALCRGERGNVLRNAGAIHVLLSMLHQLKDKRVLEPVSQGYDSKGSTTGIEEDHAVVALEFAIACLGALRDLACGSVLNRSAIREFQADDKATTTGLSLLASYLSSYHHVPWQLMDGLRLKLLTSLIGLLRNVTHSTAANCVELHRLGVSSMLVWRLLYANDLNDHATKASLPDVHQPWREAAFRAAGTLVNLSEKCPECATLCGSNPDLIPLLLDSWGGINSTRGIPLLHLGLAAILYAARREIPDEFEKQGWGGILDSERERKRVAQQKEEERKKQLSKHNAKK